MSEEFSAEIKEALTDLTKSIRLCYQCGTCAAGCPVFRVRSDKNPRLLVERLLLGHSDEVLRSDMAWYCCNCYTCSEHCPQGVDLAHVMLELKNLSVKAGNAPQSLIEEITAILTTGLTASPSGAIARRRTKLGLAEELPTPDVKEIETLIASTGLLKNVEMIKQKTKSEDSV